MNLPEEINRKPPACKQAIEDLVRSLKIPEDYVEFLKASNGADGFVCNKYLILESAEEIFHSNNTSWAKETTPHLVVFGSSGGGISYAFDTRGQEETIVEFYDEEADEDNLRFCAHSLDDFFDYLASRPSIMDD